MSGSIVGCIVTLKKICPGTSPVDQWLGSVLPKLPGFDPGQETNPTSPLLLGFTYTNKDKRSRVW